MPLEAITFTLTDLETGRVLAHALVCVQARYASVWPQNAPRPDRRHVSPADWRHIEADIGTGLTLLSDAGLAHARVVRVAGGFASASVGPR
jgi:hypothetical protein